MNQYKSSYPSTPEVPSSLRQFFETFYKISDTPEAHEKYVDCFTKDAMFIMASAKVEGSDGRSLSFLHIALHAFRIMLVLYRRKVYYKGLGTAVIWCCTSSLL